MGRSLFTALASLALTALALYLVVLGWLWWRQERLLFFPTALAADARIATGP